MYICVSFYIHMKKLLTQLGLSPIEAKLYEALVRGGVMSVSDLAKATQLYRPQVYKYLPYLIEKKLILESRHGRRTVYSAESPRQLEKLAESVHREVEAQLPTIMALYSTSTSKPTVQYFEGEQGIRRIYEDLINTLKKGDSFYRYESPRNYKAMRKYIPDEYKVRFRDNAEVDRYIITNEVTKQQKLQRLGRWIKVVPAKYDLFDYDISQLIYGDKVAFIDFRSHTATLIESPIFAEFQKKIFQLLFEKL